MPRSARRLAGLLDGRDADGGSEQGAPGLFDGPGVADRECEAFGPIEVPEAGEVGEGADGEWLGGWVV